MSIKVFNGHVTYYLGKWQTNEENERVIEKDDRTTNNPAMQYQVENVPAISKEQLIYILSVEIKKSKGFTQPIYISNAQSTLTETFELPSYSDRMDVAGGIFDATKRHFD